MKSKFTILYIVISLTALLFIRCTENPFFDDEISEEARRTVNGKVILIDQTTPDGIYVWLEGFNLSTFTDENGNFEIEIPQAKAQPGEGLNGIFNLYYYLANYEYASSSLLLINGKIEYGEGDVTANGAIDKTIVLNKILEIEINVEPDHIYDDYKDPLIFTTTLENLVDTVIVKTHHNQWGVPSSLIFLEFGADPEQALFIQGQPADLREVTITDKTTWVNSFLFSPNFFKTGNYEVRPYMQIIQKGLPDALLRSLDEEYDVVSYKYLSIPIKLEHDILYVSEL